MDFVEDIQKPCEILAHNEMPVNQDFPGFIYLGQNILSKPQAQ